MNPKLSRYLADVYRRDILRESVKITPLTSSSDVIDEIKAEIARIDAMRLGANLAQRDFVSYQGRRALTNLLAALQRTGRLAATEAADRANFRT